MDKQTEEPLSFATIFIKDSSYGTVSNEEGRFYLKIPVINDLDTLVISYLGYENYKAPLQSVQGLPQQFKLSAASNQLSEIVVTSLTAKQRLEKAIMAIDTFFINSAFLLKGYFLEEIEQMGSPLVVNEAILNVYQDKHLEYEPETQIQVLQGRVIDNSNDLAIFKKKIERMNRKEIKKAKKKMKKEKKDTEYIAQKIDSLQKENESLDLGLGGPYTAFSNDPIVFLKKALDEEIEKKKNSKESSFDKKDKYDYKIVGYTYYQGRSTTIIERKEHTKKSIKSKFYISDANEIMLVDFEIGPMPPPTLVRMALFVMGYGVEEFKMNFRTYYRPVQKQWYMAYQNLKIDAKVIKRHFFRKNTKIPYKAHLQFIAEEVKVKDIQPIPEDKQLDKYESFSKQIRNYDSKFWESYKRAR